MQIRVNAAEVPGSTAITGRVNDEVESALRLFRDQVTRVEVHLHDLNGPKHGLDKRCIMEVRLAGHQPLAVEHDALDMYEAITGAAGKLERAVRRKLERHDARRSATDGNR